MSERQRLETYKAKLLDQFRVAVTVAEKRWIAREIYKVSVKLEMIKRITPYSAVRR